MKTHPCRNCGKQHELMYQRQVNNSMHLIYKCSVNNQVIWIPYVAGLDIPVVESRRLQRVKAESTQVSLL